jgi:hypothetical protein
LFNRPGRRVRDYESVRGVAVSSIASVIAE